MDTELVNKQNSVVFSKEATICLIASGILMFPHIVSLFNGTLRMFITLPFHLDTLFVYGLFMLLILLSIKTIIERSSANNMVIIIYLFSYYLITLFVISNYYDYIIEFGNEFLFMSAPLVFVTYTVRDYK